jgi:hypothetical protein
MQKLQPLAFVPVRAPPRHVFHAAGIDQTGFHPVLFHYVVERNPVHPCGLHRHGGDPTTDQPLRHLFQVFGEGREYPHRMLVPVRWHGYKDFPRTDINTCCVRFQYRSIFQAHPFPFPAPIAFTRRGFLSAERFGMLRLLGHACDILSAQVEAKSRKSKVLFRRESAWSAASGCNHCMAHGTWDHASKRV